MNKTKKYTQCARNLTIALMLVCIQTACLSKIERVCEKTEQCKGFSTPHVCYQKKCVAQVCPDLKTPYPCYPTCDLKEKECKPPLKGACRTGVRFCINNGSAWSQCFGAITSSEEICDGKDNDCDGKTDEGKDCTCTPHQIRECSTVTTDQQLSAPNTSCQKGIQYCIQKDKKWQWGNCLFQNQPSRINGQLNQSAIQTCETLDRHCSGKSEYATKDQKSSLPTCKCPQKGQTRKCDKYNTKGLSSPCQTGMQTCTEQKNKALRWSLCTGAIGPKSEESEPCNGKDDDCDGKIDNHTGTDLPMWKTCGAGCKIQLCINQAWTLCTKRELCGNKQDDDCDGTIDEADCVTK